MYADLLVRQIPAGIENRTDIKIHKGFAQSLELEPESCFCFGCKSKPKKIEKPQELDRNSFKRTVLTKLHEIVNFDSEKPIITTGHSLGGALSQIFALYLNNDSLKNPIGNYTFAAPRSGNR